MRKTKIICTLGPATDKGTVLRELFKEGMSVARLNFSHADYDEHKMRIDSVKKLRDELKIPVAIMLDTKGPEIRIGRFKNGSVVLKSGQNFVLTTKNIEGDENAVSVSCKNLPDLISPGAELLIDDGLIETEIVSCDGDEITCVVKNGGVVSNNKSINLPGSSINLPYLTERDRNDIIFGIQNDIDYVAASFVRNVHDVLDVRNVLDQNGGEDIKIIAKIENAEGVENIDAILAESNGIMVARGDMGVEIPFDQLPYIQKKLIKKCYVAGKVAITATQMLDSMIKHPRPTRAEVTDVANAIYDGTSAIMLSGETAAGDYPVESVKAMVKIAETTEAVINYTGRFQKENVKKDSITDAISHAAVTTAIDLDAAAIITVTELGHTARMTSKFRPACNIIAVAVSEKCYRQLALSWGVTPILNEYQNTSDELFTSAIERAKEANLVKTGDIVVVTGGSVINVSGTTNVLKVVKIT